MGVEGGKLLADAIKAHPNYTQIAMNMFDGKADVDMSKEGLDAGDGHIIAAALQANHTVDSIVIGSEDKPATIPLKELRENSIDALDYQGKELLAEGGIVLASALKGNSSVTKVGQRVFDVFMFVLFLVTFF